MVLTFLGKEDYFFPSANQFWITDKLSLENLLKCSSYPVCCEFSCIKGYILLAEFRGKYWIIMWKLAILTTNMVKSIFEIICIFIAVKFHTSNFVDNPFDPLYCIPSKIVPHRDKNSAFFQCIFGKKSNSAGFFIIPTQK